MHAENACRNAAKESKETKTEMLEMLKMLGTHCDATI